MKIRKKQIGYCLYVAVVMGLCLTPLLAMGVRPGGRGTENRTPAAWPEPYDETGINWAYLNEAGDYFTDHFAFREELVAADARVRADVFGVSPVDSVIVGKNGWLYYEATLDDYQHKNGVSDRMLFNMAHNVALMQQYTESLGKSFLFTVAPNKNSLYGENMPERLQWQTGAESDMERLLPWLEREGVHYADLFALFEAQDKVLYYERDSHWNEEGAVLVYNTLLDACGKPHETYEDAAVERVSDYYGDLNRMLFPAWAAPEEDVRYPAVSAWRYTQGETVEDFLIQTACGDGSQNLLMYRDSFGNSLLPYMAQAFSRATFSKQIPYPMTDLITCEPDIVIVEKVERHLPTLGEIPPLMSGPRCFPEGESTTAESSATVQIAKEGSYWKFTGLADPAWMDVDSRIYVAVEDDGGTETYEAFCVSVTEEKEDSGDYGYLLYLSEIMVEGRIHRVRVMTEQEGRIVTLREEEVQTNL